MKRTLIIVDMQNDFIDGALKNDAAKAIVPDIVKMIKSDLFDRIICTLDTHGEDYDYTVEGEHLPVKHCIRLTDGWLLNEDIRKAVCEFGLKSGNEVQFIEKHTFGSMELAYRCGNDCKDTFEFVGTVSSICVINNVALIKALNPNAAITVYEDLCADLDDEYQTITKKMLERWHINVDKWGE